MYIRGCSISNYDIRNDYLSSHPGNGINGTIRKFYRKWKTIRAVMVSLNNSYRHMPKTKLSQQSKKSMSYYKYNKTSFSILARALE